jgi:tRNA threonylcarbamoyladenosine biosynthesis protein TsaE
MEEAPSGMVGEPHITHHRHTAHRGNLIARHHNNHVQHRTTRRVEAVATKATAGVAEEFTHASVLAYQGQKTGALLFLLCYIFIMKIVEAHSLEETQKLAKEWLNSINAKDDEATIVGLYGNLGSGKTTFTQAIARELGVKETVTSPTFVIEKLYDTNHIIFNRLIHIDAYRLESGGELQVLNFEQEVANENNLILIEWPENVKEILPKNHIKIYFEFVDENTRKFSF